MSFWVGEWMGGWVGGLMWHIVMINNDTTENNSQGLETLVVS